MIMGGNLTAFKSYDIRGRVPDQLNEDIAYRIGRAYVELFKPDLTVVGRDVRLSSESLCQALADGLMDGGSHVDDLGLCGTEEVYHGTVCRNADGGIMVTASHNPVDFNGMKLVRRNAVPVSGDSGLDSLHILAEKNNFAVSPMTGTIQQVSCREQYIDKLLSFVHRDKIKPLKVVVNAGNGCAGPVLDQLRKHLPVEMIPICHEPDGTFPFGIPNPLLPENRSITSNAVREQAADFGVAWDGDFDRCFFFDEKGDFIEGYYLVGLLATVMLATHPGEKIIHDPRLTWNSIDQITAAGGVPVQSKTGHAFIKERMRRENALYGGEMSAHHYFRDFYYADSGMIPFLIILELLSTTGKPLSALVEERIAQYPASGEINRSVTDTADVIQRIRRQYAPEAISIDTIDGLGLDMGTWRFNLRESNTEPVIRLNVESRADIALMRNKTAELLERIGGSEL
jgi:phosphomannomutase